MALSERLEFLLSADPSQAIGAFQRVGEASEKSLSQAESNVAKIGATFAKIGAAGVGLGGALTIAASGDIEAAGQLKAAIGQVGESYEEYEGRIDRTAQAQVRFGHTDEQVSKAVTTLTLSYNDAGRALDRMQLVTDLAARKHISLEEAATLVAKAHGGAAKVFREFGIQVQQSADGTKNYEGALDELAQKLQGQASASADTFGGRLSALRAEAENLFSEFGQNFGPAILGVSSALTVAGSATNVVSGFLTRRAAASAAAATAAEADALALSEEAAAEALVSTNSAAAVGSLYALSGAELDAAASSATLVASLGVIGIGLATLALAVKVGEGFYKDWQGAGVTSATAVSKAVERLGASHDIKNFNRDVLDSIGALQENGNGIKGFDDAAKQLFEGTLKGRGKDAATDLLGAITQLRADGFIPASTDIAGMRTELDEFGNTKPLDQTTEKVRMLAETAKTTAQAFDELVQARRGLLSAEIRVAGGEDSVAAAQARADAAKAKVGTGKSAEENAQLERDYHDAVRSAQSAVNDYAEASAELAQKQDKANNITHDAAYYTGIYAGNLKTLTDTLTSGDVHAGLDQYIGDLDRAAEAQQRLARATLEANAANGDKAAQAVLAEQASQARIQSQRDTGSYLTSGARASGGPVSTGTWLVGEQGPELLHLGASMSGYVYNAGQTRDMVGGSTSGSRTITNHNHFYGVDPRKAADETYLALRRLSLVG